MSRLGVLAIVASLLTYALLFASTTALPAEDISVTKRGDPSPVPASVEKQFTLWAPFAAASYCDVQNWDCGAPCEGVTAGTKVIKYIATLPIFSSHGYVAVNDKHKAVIVAFRGTSDPDSYITDADITLTDYDECGDKCAGAHVHHGYYTANSLIQDTVVPLVLDQAKQHPDYNVIVTGHSMGGAIAIFHALDLIHSKEAIPKERLFVYTYGQPRLGDSAFANYVDSLTQKGYNILRAAYQNDIVPQLPPLAFGYNHFGPEYWVDNQNELVKCSEGDSPLCSISDFPYTILSHNFYFGATMIVTCKHGN